LKLYQLFVGHSILSADIINFPWWIHNMMASSDYLIRHIYLIDTHLLCRMSNINENLWV
jgi:hypothetical protein